MNPETIFKALDPVQADGLACVVCGADFLRVPVPHLPVGRSVTRSQVFACAGACFVSLAHTIRADDQP